MIDEKHYKDLVIYFTRYDRCNTIMLNLHYHEVMGNIKEHEGKKYLMVTNYIRNEVLDRIKAILGIEEFDNTKILVDTDDKLPDNIALKMF